jgi:hypothetical protein
VQPSFYITEAAKRIRYHHIQTQCFGIVPPSKLISSPKALADVIKQLPAFARKTTGLPLASAFEHLL